MCLRFLVVSTWITYLISRFSRIFWAKRFSKTASGKVKFKRSKMRHILTKKSTTRKRQLRGTVAVHETNMGHMAQMLPFAGL